MKRPRSHQIDDQAELVFRSTLPSEWVVRKQHSDYGVDLEIEVFQDGSSTGTLIKVQVKGTAAPQFSADHSYAAYQLSTASAGYLCEELRSPSILVVVDVSSGKPYWTAPQLDDGLREAVHNAAVAGQKTVAVHVPTANQLPQTCDAMLVACADAQIRLGVRAVVEAPVPTFVAAVDGAYDPDELARVLATKGAAVRVGQMDSLYRRDELARARSTLEGIVATPDASPEVKFRALSLAEKWETAQFHFPPDTFDMLAKVSLSFAMLMRQVSVRAPLVLRLHAAIAQRSAELHLLAFEDYGLYQAWAVNQAAGDPTWLLGLTARRLQVAQALLRKHRQCGRLINFALRSRRMSVIPDAAHRMSLGLMLLIARLDSEGLGHIADSYRDSTCQLAEIGIQVSEAGQQWDQLALLAHVIFRSLAEKGNPDRIESAAASAEEHLRKITDEAVRREYIELLHKHKAQLLPGSSMWRSGSDEALQRQIYTQMASAVGIDTSRPDDPFGAMVQQGLADLNPERALRHCRNLFASLRPVGLPALLLKLPTAGVKRLHCTLHGWGMEAFTLDACAEGMQEQYCSSCTDRQPHAPDWQWTPEWQHEQNARYGYLAMDELAG